MVKQNSRQQKTKQKKNIGMVFGEIYAIDRKFVSLSSEIFYDDHFCSHFILGRYFRLYYENLRNFEQ